MNDERDEEPEYGPGEEKQAVTIGKLSLNLASLSYFFRPQVRRRGRCYSEKRGRRRIKMCQQRMKRGGRRRGKGEGTT